MQTTGLYCSCNTNQSAAKKINLLLTGFLSHRFNFAIKYSARPRNSLDRVNNLFIKLEMRTLRASLQNFSPCPLRTNHTQWCSIFSIFLFFERVLGSIIEFDFLLLTFCIFCHLKCPKMLSSLLKWNTIEAVICYQATARWLHYHAQCAYYFLHHY